MTSLLVASDVRLYREGLVGVLAGRFELVGAAADRASAVEAARTVQPDVVLVDLAMEESCETISGVAAAGLRVVALGVREVEDDVVACAEAGVAGYVTREAAIDELVDVVESVARGESLCSPRISALLLSRVAEVAHRRHDAPASRLTPREAEIVRLIDEGLSNKQIAARLSIEVATVKNHVHSILEKLEVERRGEAAALVRNQEI